MSRRWATSVRRARERRGVGCASEVELEGWGKGDVRAVCVCGILMVVERLFRVSCETHERELGERTIWLWPLEKLGTGLGGFVDIWSVIELVR